MSEVARLFGRDLPSHWQLKTMGDVSTVVGGSTPKSKEPSYWDGDIPWIAVSDLTGYEEKFIERGARLITQAGYDSCPTTLMPAGAVLFSSRAPIGYVAIAKNEVCTSQGFKSFVLNDEVIPSFVYWWLKAAKPLAERLASGTTFKEVSGRAAKRIPIPVPPVDEQRTIVEWLEARQAGLREAERDLAIADDRLQTYRGASVTAILEGQSVELSSEMAAALRTAPRKPLGELAALKYGVSAKATDSAEGPRFLRITDIQDGRVNWRAVPSCEGVEDLDDAAFLRPGDLVFARFGFTTGKTYLIDESAPASVCASYLIRIRPQASLDPLYLSYFLQSSDYWRWVRANQHGVDRPALNGTKLSKLPVPVPPPDAQRAAGKEIAKALAAVEKTREELAGATVSAANLHDVLLRDAMVGCAPVAGRLALSGVAK